MLMAMSETETADRDERTGRFLPGNSGFNGRPRGSRNKLGEAFLEDLRDAWNEYGASALAQCAKDEPGTFVRVVAGLLPKTIDLNVAVDVADFATKFRTACALLGNDIEQPRLRRPLRGQPPKVIEHDDKRR
jgi:hypothetical protein